MRTHWFASHTPEEMRHLSDLAHKAAGFLLAVVAVLAMLNAIGLAWAATAWPFFILLGGVLLLFVIYPRHPVIDWPAIWRDPQQRQHTIIAAAIAVAGAAELLRRTNPGSIWRYVWPGAMLLIGGLFLTHAQHGTGEAVVRAVRQHRILGITVILAGLFRLAEVVITVEFLAFVWPVLLLVAAIQLLIYHEPEGAFEASHDHGSPRAH